MTEDNGIQIKTISMPGDVWKEVDEQADKWRTNRSAAMLRIYQEWKQTNMRQLTLTPIIEEKEAA